MQISLKSVVATAFLAVVSTAAMAQAVVVPPQPAPGPTPTPGTGNGGLIVAAWDAVRGVSLTQYLGLSLTTVANDADMTTPGTLLNFGTLSQFSAVFGASSASNIQYLVVAADSSGTGTSGKNLAVTFSGSATTYGTINNAATSGAVGSVNQFVVSGMNDVNACNGVNPCVATNSSQNQYFGNALNGGGSNLGGQLSTSASGTVDGALHFVFIGQSGSGSSVATPTNIYRDAGTTTFGEWLLTSAGVLTYSVAAGTPQVPLPAAVWLLLSGLAGMGVIGRPKKAA